MDNIKKYDLEFSSMSTVSFEFPSISLKCFFFPPHLWSEGSVNIFEIFMEESVFPPLDDWSEAVCVNWQSASPLACK